MIFYLMRKRIVFSAFFSTVIVLMTAACQNDSISTYQVPKEAPPALIPSRSEDASSREISWNTPEGWKEQAPTEMRIGSFLITGENGKQADMSVVPLFGDAGGDLANINRWRGQISLPPIEESDFPAQSRTISPEGRSMRFVNFANQGKRLMAAIYHRNGRTWFFKMTGDDAAVSAAKPAWARFLESLQFHEN